jgi:chloramphenicol 3-O phosphotransferase
LDKGKIILLNGVSSAGKTTLARALVDRLPDYFCLGIDDFDLLIERMEDREKQRLIPVETEYFFHKTIALFSDRGINLVVDHILHDHFTRNHFVEVLHDYPVLLVGVHCPLEELERRERLRGDRTIGQACSQLAFVHQKIVYDIEVDTLQDPSGCANQVIELLQQAYNPNGWPLTRQAIAS